MEQNEEYTVIKPMSSLLQLNLKDVWRYRDLMMMYVKRNIVTVYKQTILGPLWLIVQPVLTTIMFMFVFGNLAGLSTDGIPGALFYFSGIILWNYFSQCLTGTSGVFINNQGVFGKVYFPRLVVPMATTISNLIQFCIQFCVFLVIYVYYYVTMEVPITPNVYAFLLPVLVLLCAGLSLGFGIVFSSLTTKYRDLVFLLQFGVQLWMYATPVIYPLNSIPVDKQWIFQLNPMTSIIETFKYGALGVGVFSWGALLYSALFMVVLLFVGIIIFNRIEKSFMDTV
ncbi:MAG: ABC transporter permease [Bacteroidales bacterium]|nr:ABC transporter permease [Bacteroidales bacterium]MBR6266576.1 ABC transporter permease [Bacteroidales bacterium]